jgi:hypothetical protein
VTEGERLQALFIWAALAAGGALIYLFGSFWKALLIAAFVWISTVLGFGRLWLVRGAFALSVIAIAVMFGFPPPEQWKGLLTDAHSFLAGLPGVALR